MAEKTPSDFELAQEATDLIHTILECVEQRGIPVDDVWDFGVANFMDTGDPKNPNIEAHLEVSNIRQGFVDLRIIGLRRVSISECDMQWDRDFVIAQGGETEACDLEFYGWNRASDTVEFPRVPRHLKNFPSAGEVLLAMRDKLKTIVKEISPPESYYVVPKKSDFVPKQ